MTVPRAVDVRRALPRDARSRRTHSHAFANQPIGRREECRERPLHGKTSLFPEIDELILKVNPVILGARIPLFEGPVPLADLPLEEVKSYPNGFMLRRYRVARLSGQLSS